MAGIWSFSTGPTGDERAAFGPTLSTDSWRRDRLSRDQTPGHLLSMLCAQRDGRHEDRRVSGCMIQDWKDTLMYRMASGTEIGCWVLHHVN